MALRMVHLLTFFAEDGIGITTHHNHNDRDDLFDEAVALWVSEGNERTNPPVYRLDILVPIDHDDDKVIEMIGRELERKSEIRAMASLIATLMIIQ